MRVDVMAATKEPITTADLLDLIEQQLNTDTGSLQLNTALADVPGWDSMGVLLLMAELDERLGITLNADALANLKSIQDIANAVKNAGLLAD